MLVNTAVTSEVAWDGRIERSGMSSRMTTHGKPNLHSH